MKKSTTRLLLGIALASILLLVIVGCYRYRQQKEKTDKELSIATPTVDTSAYPIAQTIYLRKDEQADMLSGTVHLPREGELLLYFPVGKRSVVYLSGPDYTESHAILSNLRSQCVQRPCREGGEGVLYAGSRRGPTIFHLPTDTTLNGLTLMVNALANEGGEVFRELSNKETYRQNEGGRVVEYLSGTENIGYEGAYKGIDPFGEIVPLSATTTSR